MSWQCTPDCFGTEMLSLAGATLAKTGFYFARSDFRCYVGKERVIEQPTFHNVSKNSQNNNKRSPITTSQFILWGQLKFIWFITATRLRLTALEIFFFRPTLNLRFPHEVQLALPGNIYELSTSLWTFGGYEMRHSLKLLLLNSLFQGFRYFTLSNCW